MAIPDILPQEYPRVGWSMAGLNFRQCTILSSGNTFTVFCLMYHCSDVKFGAALPMSEVPRGRSKIGQRHIFLYAARLFVV